MLNTNIMRITFEIDSMAKVEYMNKLDGIVDLILFLIKSTIKSDVLFCGKNLVFSIIFCLMSHMLSSESHYLIRQIRGSVSFDIHIDYCSNWSSLLFLRVIYKQEALIHESWIAKNVTPDLYL